MRLASDPLPLHGLHAGSCFCGSEPAVCVIRHRPPSRRGPRLRPHHLPSVRRLQSVRRPGHVGGGRAVEFGFGGWQGSSKTVCGMRGGEKVLPLASVGESSACGTVWRRSGWGRASQCVGAHDAWAAVRLGALLARHECERLFPSLFVKSAGVGGWSSELRSASAAAAATWSRSLCRRCAPNMQCQTSVLRRAWQPVRCAEAATYFSTLDRCGGCPGPTCGPVVAMALCIISYEGFHDVGGPRNAHGQPVTR